MLALVSERSSIHYIVLPGLRRDELLRRRRCPPDGKIDADAWGPGAGLADEPRSGRDMLVGATVTISTVMALTQGCWLRCSTGCARTLATPTRSTPRWRPTQKACATLWISLAMLGVTALIQAAVTAVSGSVALLGDPPMTRPTR